MAGVLNGVKRETDIVARYGGDEFALVLPETDQAGALALAERIREAVRQQCGGQMSVSVGVACCPDDGDALEPLVQAADDALYRAKAHRNRVYALGSGRTREQG